ncbi:unnamed protein product [Adineta ricciae]|uniref:Uncharacterized protein n=1 Tax=Adineta ricciae TaxID=249248 RepID=A0A815TVG3_ADIRI|nr:unnamed protein product [Adineta ricciae]
MALFNALPDIISRLSVNIIGSKDSFQQIISHLFPYIKNDHHCLNIKILASYRILKENFPNVTETNEQTEDDYDEEEHLTWKKYLMPVLTDIEWRLKPMEINSSRRVSASTTPKRKLDRLS